MNVKSISVAVGLVFAVVIVAIVTYCLMHKSSKSSYANTMTMMKDTPTSPCPGDMSYQMAAKALTIQPVTALIALMTGQTVPDISDATRTVGGNARYALNITGPAYFPIPHAKLRYTTVTADPTKNKVKTVTKTTDDPWEVVEYYSKSCYTMNSEYADAASAVPPSASLVQLMKLQLLTLYAAAKAALSAPLPNNTTWTAYFQTFGGPSNAVYTGKRKYFDQFWPSGKATLQPACSFYRGFQAMVKAQVVGVMDAYETLLDIGKPWFAHVLDRDRTGDAPNVLIFHQLRKNSRALGQSIPAAPGIFTWYTKPVPSTVLGWLNATFAGLSSIGSVRTYGDALGLNDASLTQYGLGYLLIVGNEQLFPCDKFWGLTQVEYDSLRGLVLMFTLKTGLKDSAKFVKAYPQAFNNVQLSPAFPQPIAFVPPSYNPTSGFSGLFGEVDDLMGGAHDMLAVYQQSPAMLLSDPLAVWCQNYTNVVYNWLNMITYSKYVLAIPGAFC